MDPLLDASDEIIWKILLSKHLPSDPDQWNHAEKMFAIKIYQNNLTYLRENHSNIILENTIMSCILIASMYSKDLEYIHFLKECFKIDIKKIKGYSTNRYNTCLTMASSNSNINIIKYYVEEIKMDIHSINKIGYNCLQIACQHNTNLEIIKYMIEVCKVNTKYYTKDVPICLMLACGFSNLEIIRYLIEECKIDTQYVTPFNTNYLMFACMHNKNLEIIKYLVKIYINKIYDENNNGDNCLALACRYNSNIEIIKILSYYIDFLTVSFKNITCEKFEQIVLSYTQDSMDINSILRKGYEMDYQCLPKLIKDINPLILSKSIRLLFNIDNPFYMKFDNFKILVDSSQCLIPAPLKEKSNVFKEKDVDMEQYSYQDSNVDIDYSDVPKILFKHNHITYYGNQKIVYNSMLFLKDIVSDINFDDPLVLDVLVPKYIINLYIKSAYDNKFDINKIKPDDFINFLKFIDQYPTSVLSIDKLENELIEYLNKHKISYEEPMSDIIKRYDLKYLYLDLHNKKVEKMTNFKKDIMRDNNMIKFYYHKIEN